MNGRWKSSEAGLPSPQPCPHPLDAHSPRSTGAPGRGAEAGPAPPPAPPAASAFALFRTGSPRPHSACSLPVFLQREGQGQKQSVRKSWRDSGPPGWRTSCSEASPPPPPPGHHQQGGRSGCCATELWTVKSHCSENHSKMKGGREFKASTAGTSCENVLGTEWTR